MGERTTSGEVIHDTLELRKTYDELSPSYSRLVSFVNLILSAAIEKENLRLHSFKARVKTYDSFLEKVARKRYKQPFKECTDLAGIRIICLFNSQIQKLREIIEKEFKIHEVTNKLTTKKYDQFGYLSLHMIVSIPKNRAKFIEFGGLSDLICEIQLRTILQEAWAEIEHYLNYKSTKAEKDNKLLRKIFSLAGMLEVADSTFEEISQEFSELVDKKIKSPASKDLTPLNLYKFSREYFTWYQADYTKVEERNFFRLTKEIENLNLKGVQQLGKILDKHRTNLEHYEKFYKKMKGEGHQDRFFSPVGLIRAGLALEFGKKFDLVFGMKNYSTKVKKDIEASK